MQILLWVAVLLLLSAALSMGVIAWRTARGVRERESARVELLRALALSDASAAPASGPSISDWTAEFLSEEGTAPAVDTYDLAASIFGERVQPVTALPRWISLSGVGAAMALGVTLYVVLAGGPKGASATTPAARRTAAPMAPATVTARTTAVPDRPIELIALQYRLGSATDFEVSGLVRNPPDGRELPQLVAVVNLLDADGRLLASQVSPVERPVLEAGQTSAFSLAFPHVIGTAARYQVQFRLHGRDTIPHVDRRAPEPGAKAPSS
jgi:hypothetical protein